MWGRHLISAVTLLAVAGCSTGHSGTAARPVAPTTSSTRPQPTTTTAARSRPLYSFDNSVPPPPLLNTGTDYPRIALSLLEYGDWILAHRPEATYLKMVVAPATTIERAMGSDVHRLSQLDRRFFEETDAPPDVQIVSVTPDAVSLRVKQYLVAQTIVARNGQIADRKKREATTYSVLLVRLGDARWYLAASDSIANAG